MGLKHVDTNELVGETIKSIVWRSDHKPNHKGYGVWTVKTESGREFVVSGHMYHFELSLQEVKDA